MENNWRNIRGAAAALEELGIPVSRGIVAEFERSFKSMPPETLDALDVTAMLLSALGVGHYDYKNHRQDVHALFEGRAGHQRGRVPDRRDL